MRLALSLARKGEGSVSPNPMVGAVLVRGGRIIGRGWHRRYGGPHAEVHAIRSARGRTRGATVYVNLEPCCYLGKTPPCTDLLIRHGIRHVVIGMLDPNPRVAGKGVRALRKAGIRVTTGVLAEECRRLNRAFAKGIATGMPFVTLKAAQTLDGFIADPAGASHWITGAVARTLVHRMRSFSDAVLVGAGTIVADDPSLTVRHVAGPSPLRIVLDGNLRSPARAKVFREQGNHPTIVVCSRSAAVSRRRKINLIERRGAVVHPLPGRSDGRVSLRALLRFLRKLGIGTLLVEGGADIHAQFLKEDLVDRLYTFVAPDILGGGITAFGNNGKATLGGRRQMQIRSVHVAGRDLLIESEPGKGS